MFRHAARKVAISVFALSLLAVAVPAVAVPAVAATQAPDSLVVQTDTGAVRGVHSDGVDAFLGIPYAAPPVGALRWQSPGPHQPWTGVRPATEYGARCAALASTNGPRTNAEDCLFINVQRPTGVTAGRNIPVYVFIHGGGLVNGSSNQASGDKIVRLTNAIVVTMNYRLGVFGFLGLGGLSSSGQGNYGFLDQQFALRWVQRNIAAFGGNPAQVTLGGESAGAFSVCGHLTSPGSRGLFVRAMMQSGSCYSRTLQQTYADSATFAAAAGCPSTGASAVQCLRSKSAAELLEASTVFSPTLSSGTAALPQPTAAAVATGQFARVPIVNGSNRDEGRTFAQGFIGWSKQQYIGWVQNTYGANASKVLARYPWPANADKFTPAYLIGAIMTDSGLIAGIGGCTELRLDETLAKWVPTWAYEFDARNGPGLTPIPGYVWGAGHAAELAYLFPSFNNGTPIAPTFNAGERQLSRNMIQYWGGFVFRGSPNFQGQAHWPRFDLTGRIMSLRVAGQSQTISSGQYRTEHQCDFWDTLT
jgi:carboxylesterase type B